MQVVNAEISNKLANMSFVCSLLVVLVHIWHPKVGSASWWIYELTSFREIAVPFFFCASGYLMAGHIGESDWWRKEFSKRVRSLIVPYFVWSLLWKGRPGMLGPSISHPVSRMLVDWVNLYTLFGWNPFLPPDPEHLWYLRSLVLVVAASPILVRFLKWKPYMVLGIALLNVFFYRGNTYDTWGYLIDRTFACGFLFYFLLGVALRQEYIKIRFSVKPVFTFMFAILLWLIFHALAVTAAGKSVQLPLTQLSTLVWLYGFWQIMPSVSWPKGLTSLAFPIYLSHWTFVILFVNTFFSNATPLTLIIKATVAVAGSLIVAYGLREIFRGNSKFLFGGR